MLCLNRPRLLRGRCLSATTPMPERRPTLEQLHPAVRLLAWGSVVAMGQGLEGRSLLLGIGMAMGMGLYMAVDHLRRLLRRARFLLLTIGLLFVCGTPGEALIPGLGVLSPTAEGLSMAAVHGGRLLLVLALLALLLQLTAAEALVAGVYGLLKPFAALPRERVALRLMLVLQYAEEQKGQGRRRSWREWLEWLEGEGADEPSQTLTLHAAPLGRLDFALIAILAAVLAVFMMN